MDEEYQGTFPLYICGHIRSLGPKQRASFVNTARLPSSVLYLSLYSPAAGSCNIENFQRKCCFLYTAGRRGVIWDSDKSAWYRTRGPFSDTPLQNAFTAWPIAPSLRQTFMMCPFYLLRSKREQGHYGASGGLEFFLIARPRRAVVAGELWGGGYTVFYSVGVK